MNPLDLILHIDKYLDLLIQNFGTGIYALLFLIIFLETGLVFTPFLPGDSLLFAAGAFAARGSLNLAFLFFLLSVAAIIGDSVNYALGKYLGPKVFSKEKGLLFSKEHLAQAQQFYAKHGPKAIVLGRFVPIIRTFVPFVAGIGRMDYIKFLTYNVIGGVLWVGIFLLGGYLFGNIPAVQENFSFFIILIVVLSLLPFAWEFAKHYWHKH